LRETLQDPVSYSASCPTHGVPASNRGPV